MVPPLHHPAPSSPTRSTPSSPDQEKYQKDIELLESECHYLSLALKNLNKYSPEYRFLESKVATARTELEALYEDNDLTTHFSEPCRIAVIQADSVKTALDYYDDERPNDVHEFISPTENRSSVVPSNADDCQRSFNHKEAVDILYLDENNDNDLYLFQDQADDDSTIWDDTSRGTISILQMDVTQHDGNDDKTIDESRPPSRSYERAQARRKVLGRERRLKIQRQAFIFWVTLTLSLSLLSMFFFFYDSKKVAIQDSSPDDISSTVLDATISSTNYVDKASEHCASFSIYLETDRYGNETSWNIVRSDIGTTGDHEDDIANNVEVSNNSNTNTKESQISGSDSDGDNIETYINNNDNNQRLRIRRRMTSGSTSASSTGVVVLSGGPYAYQDETGDEVVSQDQAVIISDICLPIGLYKFVIYDTARNGICCENGNGKYGLHLPKGRVIRPLSPGDFVGESEVTTFEVTLEDIAVVTSGQDRNHANVDGDAQNDLTDFIQPQRPSTYYDVDSLASLATASAKDLTTEIDTSKAFGIIFDIELQSTVSTFSITGLDIYLDRTSSARYEVWSKEGSWKDIDSSIPNFSDGFRQVSHGSIVGRGLCRKNSIKNCDFSTIPMKEFQEITMEGGGASRRVAFWVTLTTDSLVIQNYGGEEDGRHIMSNKNNVAQSSNSDFNLYYGAAVLTYPLQIADIDTDFRGNKGFLGRLWYKEVAND